MTFLLQYILLELGEIDYKLAKQLTILVPWVMMKMFHEKVDQSYESSGKNSFKSNIPLIY